MHKIHFCYTDFPLYFDMTAFEEVEEHVSMHELLRSLRTRKNEHSLQDTLFVAMARCGARRSGKQIDEQTLNAGRQWQNPLHVMDNLQEYNENRQAMIDTLMEAYKYTYKTPEERKDKYLAEANRAAAAKKSQKSKEGMTSIEIYSCALQAGLSYTEARQCQPGFIMDLYARHAEKAANMSMGGMAAMLGGLAGGKKRRRGDNRG